MRHSAPSEHVQAIAMAAAVVIAVAVFWYGGRNLIQLGGSQVASNVPFPAHNAALPADQLPAHENADGVVLTCVHAVVDRNSEHDVKTIDMPTLDAVEQVINRWPMDASAATMAMTRDDGVTFTVIRIGEDGYFCNAIYPDSDPYLLVGADPNQALPALDDILLALRTYWKTGALERSLYWTDAEDYVGDDNDLSLAPNDISNDSP